MQASHWAAADKREMWIVEHGLFFYKDKDMWLNIKTFGFPGLCSSFIRPKI